MFIGFYLASCGIQYLIVAAVSFILLSRRIPSSNLRKFLGVYTLAVLAFSLLGLILFTFLSIPIGNLHINFPQDLFDPAKILRSLVVIFVILLGLAGVTTPLWTLLFVKPQDPPDR